MKRDMGAHACGQNHSHLDEASNDHDDDNDKGKRIITK